MTKSSRRDFLLTAAPLATAPFLVPFLSNDLIAGTSSLSRREDIQDNWHFCEKCWSLFWNGYPTKGSCPAGGGHSAQGFNFRLPFGDALTETPKAQVSWRYCSKCFELFYDGAANKGRCSAGGGHASQGYRFRIPHDVGEVANSQGGWRYCDKCWAMFYNGTANKGRCPAGGGHNAQGNLYSLPHTPEFSSSVEEARFQQNFTTKTALGGSVDLILRSNGTYRVDFRVRNTGRVGYDFKIKALFAASNGLVFALQHDGHISSDGALSIDPDHTTHGVFEGANPLIKDNWAQVKAGKLAVTKQYDTTGVAGFIEDAANIALGVSSSVAHGAVGVVVGLGDAMIRTIDSLGGSFGIVAGVIVFASGGTMVMALTTGAKVGLVTQGLVKQKELSAQEFAFASRVLGSTGLPPANTIWKTNFHSVNGRAFTMPGPGGRIFINLGEAFDDPTNYVKPSNPMPGQLFIHEMTHVWQIHNRSFVPGWICEGVVSQAFNSLGKNAYSYGPATQAWNKFSIEQQASIVDDWFGGTRVANQQRYDARDPYYRYFTENIRPGRP